MLQPDRCSAGRPIELARPRSEPCRQRARAFVAGAAELQSAQGGTAAKLMVMGGLPENTG
ncbi:MAG TPA: hypothetical protein DDY43_14460 [Synechococcales bacterium UBA10510]|nr:hypothetical protein [Synechococcales bacterium UBA10510]